jgi:DNA-directed RNA polymerase specialized sigma24 family protein
MVSYYHTMNSSSDEAARPLGPADGQSIEGISESVADLIRRTLTRTFGLQPERAEAILAELFMGATLLNLKDPEGWLIVAACNAAAELRGDALDTLDTATPPDATAKELEAVRGLVLTEEELAALPPQARKAMRLRYHEHRSYPEIAAELRISRRYAASQVEKSLARLRARQTGAVTK